MKTATQSEFARLIGVQKSYVTKLKEQGRLVMSADGKLVNVEASKQRIQQTADPNRDDVSQRFEKPGVWKRTYTGFGSGLQPLLMFVSQPMYRPRLDLDRIRDQAVETHFATEFAKVFAS